MCDPITAVTLGGAVLSAGASLYEGQQAASMAEDLQNKQNDANAQWVAYQTKIHQDQVAAEDAAREKATSAQLDTLNKVSAPAQTAAQGTESDRLNNLYNQPGHGAAQDPNNPQGMLLGSETTGNQSTIQNITSQINNATAQARQRVAALATANSYGGSFGGLGTTVPIAFAQGGNDINMQNAIRQGNLKTYGVEQQVQPVQYAMGPGYSQTTGIANALGSLAGTLAGSGGPKLAGSLGGLASGATGTYTGAVANEASGGLTPGFTNAALTSFNQPLFA